MPFPWNDTTDFVQPRQIVVASDLTDTELLLPHVTAQAKASGAAVTLVHAVRYSPIGLPSRLATDEEDAYARQLLGQMQNSLELDGVRCSVVVKPGLAGEIVGQEIARIGAGRLIIGAHSHGSCGPNMIGSVANALLLTASLPVCVVGPGMTPSSTHASPRRILHPILPSGHYQESARFAAQIASTYQAELTVLHLKAPFNAAGPYANTVDARLRYELEALVWPPDLRVQVVLKYGEPVEEILSLAASDGIDWIIMGIDHDFPWWSMRNSRVYQVIADSPCPVLTFHSRIWNQVQPEPSLVERLHSA